MNLPPLPLRLPQPARRRLAVVVLLLFRWPRVSARFLCLDPADPRGSSLSRPTAPTCPELYSDYGHRLPLRPAAPHLISCDHVPQNLQDALIATRTSTFRAHCMLDVRACWGLYRNCCGPHPQAPHATCSWPSSCSWTARPQFSAERCRRRAGHISTQLHQAADFHPVLKPGYSRTGNY